MKRNYNLRKIKTKKSYSTQELAVLCGIHPQTVRSWRNDGLLPIDEDSHYSLFLGSAVKEYLQEQTNQRRVKLGQGEFYCLGCKAKTTSRSTKFVSQDKKIGVNKISIRYEGECIKCGKSVNRFGSLQSNELVAEQVINTSLSPSL
ncbi:MAG: helix-turn-helix domain-containing protein [bacterium]|nr:helix-turn-helix domain-containing protein [bacterium]